MSVILQLCLVESLALVLSELRWYCQLRFLYPVRIPTVPRRISSLTSLRQLHFSPTVMCRVPATTGFRRTHFSPTVLRRISSPTILSRPQFIPTVMHLVPTPPDFRRPHFSPTTLFRIPAHILASTSLRQIHFCLSPTLYCRTVIFLKIGHLA